MPLTSGARLGPYEIRAPLGSGGMGEVYRARDTRLDREVAIKVLPDALAEDREHLRRFEQEARAASALNHPNVLALLDVGSNEGHPYVVFELLEGETLRERMGGSPMPARKALDLAAQMAHGLAAAHDRGIVHRDLKPDNLFVLAGGRLKILDFGLARQRPPAPPPEASFATETFRPPTEPGTVLGTVGYMSPEQVQGLPADARSDVFSFGAILFEMLTGRRAFKRPTAVETMTAILKEDPWESVETGKTAAVLAPATDRIVRRCLEKKPEQRFQSAHDLAFALESIRESLHSSSGEIGRASCRERV